MKKPLMMIVRHPSTLSYITDAFSQILEIQGDSLSLIVTLVRHKVTVVEHRGRLKITLMN